LQCWKQALKDADEQIEILETMMMLVHKHSVLSSLLFPHLANLMDFISNHRLRSVAHEFTATLFLAFSALTFIPSSSPSPLQWACTLNLNNFR
jgi:hypothetical protein